MGCGNSKQNSGATAPTVRSHIGAGGANKSKTISVKAKLMEAIKR